MTGMTQALDDIITVRREGEKKAAVNVAQFSVNVF